MFAGKIATSRPVYVKPDDDVSLLQDSTKRTIRKDENHHIEW